MKAKLRDTVFSKYARKGDKILFNTKIHNERNTPKHVEARVLEVFENSVLIDVRHLKEYEYESTVVNHKNYTIIERNIKDSI